MKAQYKVNPALFDDYFLQSGGSYPVFQGYLTQRGFGLGGLISSVARTVIPLLKRTITPLVSKGIRKAIPIAKKGAKHLAKRTLESSVKSLADVAQRKTTPRAALHKTKRDIRGHLSDILVDSLVKGKRKRSTKQTKDVKRIKSDIFS